MGQKIFDKAGDDFEFRIVADNSLDFSSWPEEKKMHIYRIIQEALQNIKKHASASEVTVLFKQGENLKIIISDDGVGMNSELVNQINSGVYGSKQTLHFGIRNIIERVSLLGGKIAYSSEENCGTQIRVVI